MKILFTASECYPFAVSGGLGDVIGALPKALAKIEGENNDVRVVLPLYKKTAENFKSEMTYKFDFMLPLAWRSIYCGVFELKKDGVTYYFIDNEHYFRRDGLYGFYDDGERFSFFSKACLEILERLGFYPDIIHSHDWHTALVPILFKRYYKWKHEFSATKAIFTIHNIQYQGQYDEAILGDVFGLGDGDRDTVTFNGCINLMKGAIVAADKVNTVSPNYARELTYPYYAHGLSAIIREHQYKFCGILNGIDNDRINPETNPHLYANFNYRSPAKMAFNKKKLQEEMNLPQDDTVPVVAIISRLVSHKGIDLVRGIFSQLMDMPLQLVVLGTGDREYEDFFRYAASRYKGKLEVRITFDGALADRIYGGADMILMPSKSEPCGLVQMIALRYGTIPIVRETGGLKDSITDVQYGGNGFSFPDYNAHELLYTVGRAVDMFRNDKDGWKALKKKAMKCDFGWDKAAGNYFDFYKDALGRK